MYIRPSDSFTIEEKAQLFDQKYGNNSRNKAESVTKETTAIPNSKQGMFSQPFYFEGRIRRTEYGISFIIVVIANTFLNAIVESGEVPLIGLAYIPTLWFLWAQGAKRCHDIGQSGWYQIIPFYVIWMIFASGEGSINKYGLNPKG